MWLSKTTMSWALAHASTTASNTSNAGLPFNSGLAAKTTSSLVLCTGTLVNTIHEDQGNRMQLKPMPLKVSAMSCTFRYCKPPTTPSCCSAPPQFTHANLTRLPSLPRIQRPSVWSGRLISGEAAEP